MSVHLQQALLRRGRELWVGIREGGQADSRGNSGITSTAQGLGKERKPPPLGRHQDASCRGRELDDRGQDQRPSGKSTTSLKSVWVRVRPQVWGAQEPLPAQCLGDCAVRGWRLHSKHTSPGSHLPPILSRNPKKNSLNHTSHYCARPTTKQNMQTEKAETLQKRLKHPDTENPGGETKSEIKNRKQFRDLRAIIFL